jgi:hypothetical protein
MNIRQMYEGGSVNPSEILAIAREIENRVPQNIHSNMYAPISPTYVSPSSTVPPVSSESSLPSSSNETVPPHTNFTYHTDARDSSFQNLRG